MGYGISESATYQKIYGWSWSAFFLTPFWAIGNRVWIGLLCLIPYVGFIVSIVMGIYGNRLAFDKFEGDREAFYYRKVNWLRAFLLGIVVIFLVNSPFIAIRYSEMKKDEAVYKEVFNILNHHEEVKELFGDQPLESGITSSSKFEMGQHLLAYHYTIVNKSEYYFITADYSNEQLTEITIRFMENDKKNIVISLEE